jgi:hypothetical protein
MNVGDVIAIVFWSLFFVGGGVGILILISKARNERAGRRQRKSKYRDTGQNSVNKDSGAACGGGGGGHSCGGHSCGGHGCGL